MEKLSNINESLWKDSIKRGRGEEVRKENDVDLLDWDGFKIWCVDNYVCDKQKLSVFDNFIVFPTVFEKNSWLYISIEHDIDNINYKLDMNYDICTYNSGLEAILEKKYKTSTHSLNGGTIKIISIEPKTGDIKFSFFVEVLNTIIDNSENCLLKRNQ